jgi:hypothetical protein
MKLGVKFLLLLFLSPLVSISVEAQCETGVSECTQAVPHFVKFNGALRTPSVVPRSGVVAIKFVIYSAATGGTPLWQEVQNTLLDQLGHYEVMLGVTGSEGIPSELFTSGEPRWLGVQVLLPGEEEQPRVLLVSVPYAVEAQNAQTLAGLPASAFARVAPSTTSAVSSGTQTVVTSAGAQGFVATVEPAPSVASAAPTSAIEGRAGPVNVIPKFSGGGLASSQITDAGGTVTLQNLANMLFADQFSGGVAAAITACPANGCIIYAVSPAVSLNLGNIDPGFKSITIYLGPYAYTVNQVTLRKGLKIIGMGASYGGNGSITCNVATPCNGTSLQSVNGNNPVFVLPQTNNNPVTDVLLSGFLLSGSAGNTNEDGFLLDTSATVNTGLWYSILDDIHVAGFAGVGIHVKGRPNDFASTSQWVLFNNVAVFRTPGGGNALKMEGGVFDLRFTDCEFDGQALGDGTNIYIGGSSAGGTGGYPTSISFEGLVSQQAGLAVQIDGAANVTFHASHHELLWGGYQITNNTSIGTRGLTITDSFFGDNVGTNGGKGYELNITTTQAFGVVFAHNQLFGSPDAIVKGINFSTPVYQDNWYAGSLNSPPTSGVTTQVTPAASINIQGAHTIGLNPGTTPIATIQSSLGPGEMVTFFTLAGPVTFSSGGNVDLMGMTSLVVNGTITFVASDLGGSLWKPVSQWSPSAATP